MDNNKAIIVLSRVQTAKIFNNLMKTAIKHYWPNHWNLQINTAPDKEDFLQTLANILKNAPPAFLLIFEDQIPVRKINETMLNFAANKILEKKWSGAATFITKTVSVMGIIDGGWARISDTSEYKANLQPTIWDRDFLLSIVLKCKELAGKETGNLRKDSVRKPWGFDKASAKIQNNAIVYRAVLENPWPIPHSGFMWGGKVWFEKLNAEFRRHGLRPLEKCPLSVAEGTIKDEHHAFDV